MEPSGATLDACDCLSRASRNFLLWRGGYKGCRLSAVGCAFFLMSGDEISLDDRCKWHKRETFSE